MAADPRQDTTANGQRFNLADYWSQHYERFRDSRERVRLCALLRRGEDQPAVPSDMDSADAFRIQTPMAPKLVQDVMQNFTAKLPDIKRNSGPGPMAERTAEKIEHFLGQSGKAGALGELRSGGEEIWESLVAHSAEGEYGMLVVPRAAHWSGLLDFTEPDPDNPEGPGKVQPFFQRDASGNSPEDILYANPHEPEFDFQIDDRKSADAYYAYARDAKARRLPIVAVVLAPDVCLPIGLDPATGRVDALLVRTVRSARSLNRDGFHWVMLGAGDAPTDQSRSWMETSVLRGLDQRLLLYELWVPGGVYYQIGSVPPKGQEPVGYPTSFAVYKRDGSIIDRHEAFVNLEAEYGITDVPGGYFYGCHWAAELDPDKKGYPLLWTYRSIIKGLNQTVSADVAHMYNVAYGGWLIDPTGIDPKFWTENGRPMSVRIKRGEVTYVAGKPVPAVHPGVNKDTSAFITFALSQLGSTSPPGPGSQAGAGPVAMGVAQVNSEYAQAQILAGAVRGYKRCAEIVLEITAALSERLGEPIPVYTRIDRDGKRHDLLELSSKDINSDYGVDVVFPTKKGSNVPLAQAGYQWMQGQNPAISHYTWLSDMWGEEFPEEEIDKINVEKALNSPEGQKLVWDIASKISGDREMAKIAKLQQAGQMTLGGTPTALLPPRPPVSGGVGPAGTPAPGTAGVQAGNPAISSLGGQMNATMGNGIQSDIMQQTGQGAALAPNGAIGG
jgi:hypothetical protein